MLIRHESNSNKLEQIKKMGKIARSSRPRIDERLPICQNTIDESSVCSSATNFIIANTELKNPPTMIPESTSIILRAIAQNTGNQGRDQDRGHAADKSE